MAMTLRLDADLDRALAETAEREHASKQAIAVKAIREYTSRRTQTRDQALARILREDANLLHRLAE